MHRSFERFLQAGLFLIILLAVLMASSPVAAAESGRQQTGDLLYEVYEGFAIAAEQFNHSGPQMVDQETRQDFATAGPGAQITYYYTFINYSSREITSNQLRTNHAPGLKNRICTNESTERVIRAGGTFNYVYRGNDGIEIARFAVNRQSCFPETHIQSSYSPALKPGWSRVYIENLGTIDLPPTLEVQAGAYKEFDDSSRRPNYQLVAQQKGLNEGTESGRKTYARVMINTELGDIGDYEKLNFDIRNVARSDIAEFEMEIKRVIKQGFSQGQMGGKQILKEWYPVKLEKINGMSCFHTNYIRQLDDNPVVLVHTYMFQNNDRMHTLILSYRLKDSGYWESDFADILKSFVITNIR